MAASSITTFLLCACAYTTAMELPGFLKDPVILDEFVFLNVTQQSEPDQGLHVRFALQGRPILLKLVRKVSGDIEGSGLYYDSKHTAVLSVRSPSRNILELTGSFMANHKTYYIQPTTTTMAVIYGEAVPHRIVEIRGARVLTDRRHGNYGNTGRLATRKARRYKRSKLPTPSTGHLSATVEIAFVVDKAAYSRWTSILGLTGSSKATWAVEMLYTLHADGVCERFKTLNTNDFSINVTVNGVNIIKEDRYDYWSTYNNGTYNGTESLRKFTEWANRDLHNIIPADHYVLVTGHNVSINNSKSGGTFGSMCSNLSTSIVQDNLDFIIQTHITHRLAESIGATLDEVENACRDDGYVMSPGIYPRFGPNANQPWWFSACSASEIEHALRYGASAGDPSESMCLNPSLGDARYQWHENMNYPLPGRNISGDDQCRSAYGTGYFVCRVKYTYDYSHVCPGMYCCDNITGVYTKAIVPADGTPCVNQKHCRKGLCVHGNTELNPVLDGCVFGDYPGTLRTAYGSELCQDIVGKRPAECYNATIELNCCWSCNRARTHSLSSDCQFGDRGDCDDIHYGYQCYDADTLHECCATCDDHRTTIPGQECAFGDRNETVCHDIELMECYHRETDELCCETCHSSYTGNPECPFGDRLAMCKPEHCYKYSAENLRACCKTCESEISTTTVSSTASYSTPDSSQSACGYRDEISTCESADCHAYGTDKLRKCCVTCQSTTSAPLGTTAALSSNSKNVAVTVAASVSAVAVVVIIIVVAVCWIRRRRNNPKHLSPIDEVMYNEYKLSAKANNRAPVPQPRVCVEKKPHPLERQDTGEYAYISPEQLASIPRHDSDKSSTDDKKSRDGNDPLPPVPGDYLELKLVDNYGYMEAVDKSKKTDAYNEVFDDKKDPYNEVYEDKMKKDPYCECEAYEDNLIKKPGNEYVKLKKGEECHKYGTSNNGYVNERF